MKKRRGAFGFKGFGAKLPIHGRILLCAALARGRSARQELSETGGGGGGFFSSGNFEGRERQPEPEQEHKRAWRLPLQQVLGPALTQRPGVADPWTLPQRGGLMAFRGTHTHPSSLSLSLRLSKPRSEIQGNASQDLPKSAAAAAGGEKLACFMQLSQRNHGERQLSPALQSEAVGGGRGGSGQTCSPAVLHSPGIAPEGGVTHAGERELGKQDEAACRKAAIILSLQFAACYELGVAAAAAAAGHRRLPGPAVRLMASVRELFSMCGSWWV